MEFLEVKLGAVTFVLTETVLRKLRAELAHERVACHFRDHARGRDAQAHAVAIDNRGLWKRKGKHGQTIDQDMIGEIARPATAIRIAWWEARRILTRSISTESTTPIAQTISE